MYIYIYIIYMLHIAPAGAAAQRLRKESFVLSGISPKGTSHSPDPSLRHGHL